MVEPGLEPDSTTGSRASRPLGYKAARDLTVNIAYLTISPAVLDG